MKSGVREEEWEGFERNTQRETERAERDNTVALRHDKRLRAQGSKVKPLREERATLAEQARRLLSGREKWRSTKAQMGTEEFWKRDGTYEKKGGQQEARS